MMFTDLLKRVMAGDDPESLLAEMTTCGSVATRDMPMATEPINPGFSGKKKRKKRKPRYSRG